MPRSWSLSTRRRRRSGYCAALSRPVEPMGKRARRLMEFTSKSTLSEPCPLNPPSRRVDTRRPNTPGAGFVNRGAREERSAGRRRPEDAAPTRARGIIALSRCRRDLHDGSALRVRRDLRDRIRTADDSAFSMPSHPRRDDPEFATIMNRRACSARAARRGRDAHRSAVCRFAQGCDEPTTRKRHVECSDSGRSQGA